MRPAPPSSPLSLDLLAVTVIVFNSTYAVAMVEMKHIKNFYMAHIHSGGKHTNG